jgi:non-specific serine/threonine protein kinase
MEPSEQTRALYQKLKVGKEVIEAGSIAPVTEKRKPTVSPPTNLPVPLTSFVGRQNEIDQVINLLKEKRLITLTGSGGVGKTRLAIESANKLLPKFKDGVLWVDLGSLADPALLPQAVAQAAGVPEILSQSLIETLAAHFRFKHALLILDNCEHLVLACAQLADHLLSTCANLKMLATSREGLDILGETIWQVPSLSIPDGQVMPGRESLRKFESIQLFIDRAVMIQPTFELADQNARSIMQICRRLSGMPLAIELAAARVKMLSVEEIAQRLDDRFRLLTGGSRTALPRHQTLRATIDWSYDILSEPERILFRRLSGFVGGFTLDAAEAVAVGGDDFQLQVIDLLGQLINKSLVTVVAPQAESDAETRYGMLETIREYAFNKLRDAGEEENVRNCHLAYFVKLVEELEPKLERAEQQVWLDRLEFELDNLRSAIDWALASLQTIAALREVAGLRRFWLIRNHDSEGMERLRTILSRSEAAQPTSARLKALNTYFFLLWAHGKLIDVQALIEEALALGVKLEDSWNTAFTFLWAGVSAAERGDYFNAQLYLRQSRAEWHDAGDATYEAISLVFLGENAMLHNHFALARELFEVALQRFREVKDYPFLGIVLRRLGQLAVSQGDLSLAASLIREALVCNWNIRDYRGTGACFAALADVSATQGRIERAARLFGVVESILAFTQIPLLPFDQQEYERNGDRLRFQLDGAIFSKPWSEGRAMKLEHAVSFALEESRNSTT